MKIKLPFFIIVFFLATFYFTSQVRAADFKLTAIGTLDVSETLYSHMWYTGNQPNFSGTGNKGAAVSITVDGNSYSTTVNDNDQWSWKPPAPLENTDHSLSFVSEEKTVLLTLTTGSTVPENVITTPSASPSGLPQAGLVWPTILTLGSGCILILYPLLKKLAYKLGSD